MTGKKNKGRDKTSSTRGEPHLNPLDAHMKARHQAKADSIYRTRGSKHASPKPIYDEFLMKT